MTITDTSAAETVNFKPDRDNFIKIDLCFFAEGSGGEKTEQPSARKKDKARKEGQVAKSPEISVAFMLIVVFTTLRIFAGNVYSKAQELFSYNLGMIPETNNLFDPKYAARFVNFTFTQVLFMVAPFFIITMIVGILANLVQVKWKPTTKPLRPKLSKLNPINGAKRIFKLSQLVELFKSLVKFAIIMLVLYMIMSDEIKNLPGLYELSLINGVIYIGNIMINMGINVGVIYIFIALADYFYARYKHIKSLKMTKQEVKDEYKEIEGDPHIKGKIRQKMREVSMRRMMQELPNADVIITNPTHYAIALGYEKKGSKAPIVIAKGADFIARRIKEYGAKHDIAIVENKLLARTLYQAVDIGQEIPPELYQAVAEVLAYVYRLKNKVS